MRRRIIHDAATRCTPQGSTLDKCIPATRKLIADLEHQGIDACPVRMQGRIAVAERADATWLAIGRDRWVHYAAWLPDDEIAIDLTATQYDPEAGSAVYWTMDALRRDWREVLVLK